MNNTLTPTALLIYKLRIKHKLSQEELGKIIGVQRASICNWENGKAIKVEFLCKLAQFFEITVEELINGKLNSTSLDEYIQETFDLSKYNFNYINDDNIDMVEKYFDTAKMIQKTFKDLLLTLTTRYFNNLEAKEFEYLQKYYKFNYQYYLFLKSKHSNLYKYNFDDYEKQSLFNKQTLALRLLKEVCKDKHQEFDWEINKLFICDIDFKFDLVKERPCGIEFIKMIDNYNQLQKDSLLTSNFNKIMDSQRKNPIFFDKKPIEFTEIETNPFIRSMIKSGCRVMKLSKYATYANIQVIDEPTFNCLKGNKKEIYINMENELNNTTKYYGFDGRPYNYGLSHADELSYSEYEELIDFETTSFLQSLVKYKNNDPLKYLNSLEDYLDTQIF